jgi:hypothetical protein
VVKSGELLSNNKFATEEQMGTSQHELVEPPAKPRDRELWLQHAAGFIGGQFVLCDLTRPKGKPVPINTGQPSLYDPQHVVDLEKLLQATRYFAIKGERDLRSAGLSTDSFSPARDADN